MTKKRINGEVVAIAHASVAKVKFLRGCFSSKVKKHIVRRAFLRARFYPQQNIKVGDLVCAEEVRPLSKTLFWVIRDKSEIDG